MSYFGRQMIICLCFVGWLGLTIYMGLLFNKSQIFVAPGTLLAVDQCVKSCAPLYGCVHFPKVTVAWHVDDIAYQASNITAGAACENCCYSTIGQNVSVKIDPNIPSVAIIVLPKNTPQYTYGYIGLEILFAFFTCVFLVAFLIASNDKGPYESIK